MEVDRKHVLKQRPRHFLAERDDDKACSAAGAFLSGPHAGDLADLPGYLRFGHTLGFQEGDAGEVLRGPRADGGGGGFAAPACGAVGLGDDAQDVAARREAFEGRQAELPRAEEDRGPGLWPGVGSAGSRVTLRHATRLRAGRPVHGAICFMDASGFPLAPRSFEIADGGLVLEAGDLRHPVDDEHARRGGPARAASSGPGGRRRVR